MSDVHLTARSDEKPEAAVGEQFTPGPWVAEHDGHGGMSVEGADGQIGFVSNRRAQKANAHLIAAAPLMYEALAALTKAIHLRQAAVCGNDDKFTEFAVAAFWSAQDDALAALRKARGEQQ